MRRLRIPVALGILCAGLLLCGCSGPTGISAFDLSANDEDTLPDGGGFPEGVDVSSVRLLAVNDGVKYFGATTADKSMGCVLTYLQHEAPGVGGCGGLGVAGEVVEVSPRPPCPPRR